MIKQLYWSPNGASCTFVGVWRPSGKLEIEYWWNGGQAWVTLRKKAKTPAEAHKFFEQLSVEINLYDSIAHWLGHDLVTKGDGAA